MRSTVLLTTLALFSLNAAADPEKLLQSADVSIAAVHSDIAFALTTGPRQKTSCTRPEDVCADRPDIMLEARFEAKIKEVAAILEEGALELFPDLAKHIPGAADGIFDVFVVDSDRWETDSSASGKIAISSAINPAAAMEDYLAFLIAREMAHVIARHHEQNSAASILTSLAMNLVVPGSSLIKSAVALGGSVIASESNRDEQERRANELATLILRAAGYKPEYAAFSSVILKASPNNKNWSPQILAASDNLLVGFQIEKPLAKSVVIAAKPKISPAAPVTLASPVITYMSSGSIITSHEAGTRKVAHFGMKRSSYYDLN